MNERAADGSFCSIWFRHHEGLCADCSITLFVVPGLKKERCVIEELSQHLVFCVWFCGLIILAEDVLKQQIWKLYGIRDVQWNLGKFDPSYNLVSGENIFCFFQNNETDM